MKVAKRHRAATPRALSRGTQRLLRDVPAAILASFPVDDRGLADGLQLIGMHWYSKVCRGELREPEMHASIVPVVALASMMLTAWLRGTPIGERAEAFERLVEESQGALAGEPKRVLLTSGIA